MNTCTVDDVMSWHPCKEYTRERIEALWAGRPELTVLDILDLDIPAEDKLWATLHSELIPEQDLHELACRFAEDVLPIYEREYPDDHRPRRAIETKRKWLKGEATDEELESARLEAWAAVWAARAAGARAMAIAARAAVRAAVQAAWAAGARAAWAVAREAAAEAWAAREAREELAERQVEIVREVVEGSREPRPYDSTLDDEVEDNLMGGAND